MNKTTCTAILLLFAFIATGQSNGIALSHCEGAINVFDNGDYSLQFTGKKSRSLEQKYPSLKDKTSENQIWCSYIASEDGMLNFTATTMEANVKMIIFKQEGTDICEEVERGIAEIQRLQIKPDLHQVGLNKETGNGLMYPLKLIPGEKIQIVFFTEEKLTNSLKLKWNFKPDVKESFETKVLDLRNDDFAPTLSIKIRDKETKQPLIGNLTLKGTRDITALYVASDFYFNIERKYNLIVQCDVEGYFFNDMEVTIDAMQDRELTIEVEKVSKGRKIQLEEIEFKPGTSIITASSEPKLNRLKDFLALNSDLKVEIHGHVHAIGKNSMAAQRMSESRAKQIMKFLADNGIAKARMATIGFGNTKPIFEDPKFSYEEQANRRVEIVIM